MLSFAVLAIIVLGFVLHLSTSSEQQGKGTAVLALLNEYTQGKEGIKLTVGLLKEDIMNYKVFGEDSKAMEPAEYEYEIGSVSKTFTTSILCKAIDEGKVNLEDSIDKFLPLEPGSFYPNILSLATHTSGYGEYPFDASTLSEAELQEIDTRFYEKRQNIYRGINRQEMLERIRTHVLIDKDYKWEYSNFGMAVLGMVLGEAYNTSYRQLADDFIQSDLGLTRTRMSNGSGNLSNYWTWSEGDAYLASGGIVSTVTDLLKYSRRQLYHTPKYLSLSQKTYMTFQSEGLAMGLGWIIEPETGYLWHNGSTSSYTSFLGMDSDNKSAVVILSNYPVKEGTREEDMLDMLGYMLLDDLRSEDADVNHILDRMNH